MGRNPSDFSGAAFAASLLRWFDSSRRDLPWRVAPGSPAGRLPPAYHVFVSEAMLQQTQVATVIPYFHRFVSRFPDFAALAAADEQEVLRLWQGLGYYSRARNLQRAARAVVGEHGGELPRQVDALRALPGVGRYTAGAIASIAFDRRAPIVDGNVARVLCRIDRIESDPREKVTVERLWRRAEELVPQRRPGDFNSAMMELGATVCTPRNPQCLVCPVNRFCRAYAAGVQDRIPPPRAAKVNPLHQRWTFCLRRPSDGRWLIEQRPATGRWAGLWQFVTIEAEPDVEPTASNVKAAAGFACTAPAPLGLVTHGLTHRRYEFRAFRCDAKSAEPAATAGRAWVSLEELDRYPMSKPQLSIARLLSAIAAAQ